MLVPALHREDAVGGQPAEEDDRQRPAVHPQVVQALPHHAASCVCATTRRCMHWKVQVGDEQLMTMTEHMLTLKAQM